jgi:hypothetical protein
MLRPYSISAASEICPTYLSPAEASPLSIRSAVGQKSDARLIAFVYYARPEANDEVHAKCS